MSEERLEPGAEAELNQTSDGVSKQPESASVAADQATPGTDTAVVPQEPASDKSVEADEAKSAAALEKKSADEVKTEAAPAETAPVVAKPAAAAAKPAPAKKAPPPPNPKVEAAKAEAEKIRQALEGHVPAEAIEEVGAAHYNPMLLVKKEHWVTVQDALRTHPDYLLNYVECMAGTDYPNYMEVVTYNQSTSKGHFVCVKTRTERENPEIPTLTSVHPGVNWEEREIYDLLGITFTNHPDLRRIMLDDDFSGHPLRKDYSAWD